MKRLIFVVAIIASVLVSFHLAELYLPKQPEAPEAPEQNAASKDTEIIAAWIKKKNRHLSSAEISQIINSSMRASQKFFVDPLLLLGMMQQESSFRPQVRSGYGAVGLMQVVPRFHAAKFAGEQPDDIQANIYAGAWVLRDCQKKHKYDMGRSLACYSGHTNDSVTTYKNNVLRFRADLLNTINKER